MRTKILDSLHQKQLGVSAEAEANIEIYLRHPAGIGEHPDVIGAIDSQVARIAEAKEKLELLREFR